MIPNSIFTKMKTGVSIAAIAVASSSFGFAEENVKSKALCCVPARPPELTADQLKTFNALLADFTAQDATKQNAAFNGIFALGKGAIQPLTDASNQATDPLVKRRMNYLIRYINAGGDPCPTCGMG